MLFMLKSELHDLHLADVLFSVINPSILFEYGGI
jgi:hypothetical protein